MNKMLLEDVVEGASYIINAIDPDIGNRRLLESMGISLGREITISQNNDVFPFIVRICGTRYALSKEYLKKIIVCPAEECDDEYQSPGDCDTCRKNRRRRHGR